MKQYRTLVFILWLFIILLLSIQGCTSDKNTAATAHLPAGKADMPAGTAAYNTDIQDTGTPGAVPLSAEDTDELQETKVLSLLEEAFTRTVVFEISSPQLDYNTKIVRGDKIYYPVIDQSFPKSLAKLRKYVEEVYTPRISEALINTGKYIEVSGKLYSYGGEMGTLKNYARSRIKSVSETGSPEGISRLYKIEVPKGISEATGGINYISEKVFFKYVPGAGWRVNTELSP